MPLENEVSPKQPVMTSLRAGVVFCGVKDGKAVHTLGSVSLGDGMIDLGDGKLTKKQSLSLNVDLLPEEMQGWVQDIYEKTLQIYEFRKGDEYQNALKAYQSI